MSMSSYRRTAFHHANSSFTPVNALVWMVLRLSVVGAGGDFQIPISLFGRTMGRVGGGVYVFVYRLNLDTRLPFNIRCHCMPFIMDTHTHDRI